MGAEVGNEEGRSREIAENERVKLSVRGWYKDVFKVGLKCWTWPLRVTGRQRWKRRGLEKRR